MKLSFKNFSEIKTLFFENIGFRQTIIKNTFWLALAEAISRFLKLALIIYVARILGATEYGKFNFALAFSALFSIFTDLGISQILTREIAKTNEKEKEFPSILSLKIFLSFFTLFLILIGSFFITDSLEIRKIIWVLAVFSIIESVCSIFFSFFQAKQKMEYQAWTKILEATLVTAFGFFVLLKFPSIINLSYSYLLSAFLALVFILALYHFKVAKLKISFNFLFWKNILFLSWPLALSGLFSNIYTQTDTLVMGYLKQITQIGWYQAVYKIAGASVLPASLITYVFFPAMSSVFLKSREQFQKIWDYFLGLMIFLAVPIVIGGIALTLRIIDFVYDPSFFPAALAFQILLIMIGISFLISPFAQFLIIANQQKKMFWIIFFGAILNFILNIFLIPKYSLYGAAFTTLISSVFVLILFYFFSKKLTVQKIFNKKMISTFIGSFFSSISMYFLIIHPFILKRNLFLVIALGAIIYFFSFFLYYIFIKKLLKIRN